MEDNWEEKVENDLKWIRISLALGLLFIFTSAVVGIFFDTISFQIMATGFGVTFVILASVFSNVAMARELEHQIKEVK